MAKEDQTSGAVGRHSIDSRGSAPRRTSPPPRLLARFALLAIAETVFYLLNVRIRRTYSRSRRRQKEIKKERRTYGRLAASDGQVFCTRLTFSVGPGRRKGDQNLFGVPSVFPLMVCIT